MSNLIGSLPFRGTRDYIHGTSLFSLLLPFAVGGVNIIFRCNKVIKSNSILIHSDIPSVEAKKYPCTLEWEGGGRTNFVGVIGNEKNTGAELREPYDEDVILGAANIYHDSIIIKNLRATALIDAIVALNKALLGNLYPRDDKSKYVFTRLDLNVIPRDTKSIKVQFIRRIGHDHFMSYVFIDDAHIGSIFFSLWFHKL